MRYSTSPGAPSNCGSHTTTHFISPLIILQFNNIVTDVIYGYSKGLPNCHTQGKAAKILFGSNNLCNN